LGPISPFPTKAFSNRNDFHPFSVAIVSKLLFGNKSQQNPPSVAWMRSAAIETMVVATQDQLQK